MSIYTDYSNTFCSNRINNAINELTDLKSRLEKHYGEMDITNNQVKTNIRGQIDEMNSTLDTWIEQLEGSKTELKWENANQIKLW